MNAVSDIACETPISDHIARFWKLLREGHVRILVDTYHPEGFGGLGHTSSSSFPDDCAKALAAENARLREALTGITALECEPFVFPADLREQIEQCAECQHYKDHPIQQGICNEHRKPFYARQRHDDHQQNTLIYKARDIARAALEQPRGTGDTA